MVAGAIHASTVRAPRGAPGPSRLGVALTPTRAHASATPDDVVRDRNIIGISPEGPSTVVPLIKAYLVRQ